MPSPHAGPARPTRTWHLTRRHLLAGTLVAGSAGQARHLLAQEAGTPDATQATPAPDATPAEPTPLQVIQDQRPEWAGEPVPGGDLRLFARVEGLEDFNPTAFRQDFQVTASYLDPLIWLDEVSLEPRPWLAERWEWSENGLELRITLRDDVRWHDGSPLTAADVQFSLLCHRDDYDSAGAFMLAVVNDVQAPDARTVRVLFDEPDGAFPYNAGNLPVFNRTQYATWWEAQPPGERSLTGFDWKASPPLGTGPWIVGTGSATSMTFSRNEAHFTAVPHAERLLLEAQPDPTQQVDAWRRGDVDLVWPVSGAQVEDLWDERGFVVAAEATVSYFAAYNFGNPTRYEPGWMAFPGIREALSLAIDREGFARDVFGGFIHVERAGFMTQSWAIDPSVRNPTRNVDEANRILDAEGWLDQDGDGVRESPSGDSANLVCIVREDADPGLLGILDRLDADLREIGVRLEVQRLAPDAFTLRWTTAFDYDLSAWSLTQYGAFAEFDLVGSPWSIRRNPAGWNPGGYWNPEVDEAISVYFQSWRQEDMAQALRTIQRLTNDDPFALWLGFPQQPVLIRPDVAGFQPNRVWQSWNTWSLWRSEGAADLVTPMTAPETVPVASPVATPVTSTPITSIPGTPGATPAPR